MERDYSELFDTLLKRFTATIEDGFLDQLKRAKNKAYVHDKIVNQVRGIVRFYSVTISKHSTAFNYFIEKYNKGETIENILSKIKTDYPEALKMVPEIDERENVELIPFGKEEEILLKEFPNEINGLIAFHVGYLALDEINKRMPDYLNQSKTDTLNETSPAKYPIKWTSPKDNKNEFVQLIYGLHKAGLINEGKGEITKIMETLAEDFKIDLGKGWQANHSSSIHRAKEDYHPRIFHKIQLAYEQYITEQLTLKKNKK